MAEAQTSFIPANSAPVDYNYDYFSYSIGANYLLTSDLSVFARYSKGGRANADRILFNDNNVSTTTGELRSDAVAIDFVKQAEAGVKYRGGGLALYATGFYAETEEENFEATTQAVFSRSYEAYGVELEGSYRLGAFSLSAGATYTDAEIKDDNISPANIGNTPRRQRHASAQASKRNPRRWPHCASCQRCSSLVPHSTSRCLLARDQAEDRMHLLGRASTGAAHSAPSRRAVYSAATSHLLLGAAKLTYLINFMVSASRATRLSALHAAWMDVTPAELSSALYTSAAPCSSSLLLATWHSNPPTSPESHNASSAGAAATKQRVASSVSGAARTVPVCASV